MSSGRGCGVLGVVVFSLSLGGCWGDDEDSSSLALLTLDGKVEELVQGAFLEELTPDGKDAVLIRSQQGYSEVLFYELASKKITSIMTAETRGIGSFLATLSPEGDVLAVLESNESDSVELTLVSLIGDGGQQPSSRLVVTLPPSSQDPQVMWTPDGEHLMVGRGYELLLVAVADGSVRSLSAPGPGEEEVFFRAVGATETHVLAMRTDDAREPTRLVEIRLSDLQQTEVDPGPVLTASLGPGGELAIILWEELVVRTGGGEYRFDFPEGWLRARPPAWTRSGDRVAVSVASMVVVVDVATGDTTELPIKGEAWNLHWTADGGGLLYLAQPEYRD